MTTMETAMMGDWTFPPSPRCPDILLKGVPVKKPVIVHKEMTTEMGILTQVYILGHEERHIEKMMMSMAQGKSQEMVDFTS